ncbi:MAG: hypothetical protein M3N33_04375 [Actinomycetota bacterium]|nr:hypothetical protein [Actinomycetota bacterium]
MPNSRATRWLIADLTDGNMNVFTIDDGGERVLPIFSFLDEAEMYVRLQLGSPLETPGWGPRASSAGEIVSVLYGPLSDVTRVALDPLPEVCGATVLDLLCVRREAFVLSLVGEGRGAASSAGTTGHPAEDSPRRPGSAVPFTAARTLTNPPSLWREDVL